MPRPGNMSHMTSTKYNSQIKQFSSCHTFQYQLKTIRVRNDSHNQFSGVQRSLTTTSFWLQSNFNYTIFNIIGIDSYLTKNRIKHQIPSCNLSWFLHKPFTSVHREIHTIIIYTSGKTCLK